MSSSWRQTPDGRPSNVEYSPDRDAGAPERSPPEPRLPSLEPFIEGTIAAMPEMRDDGARLGLLLFLLGAADRFWDRNGLDDTRYPRYAESLLRRLGADAERAATLVAALAQLPEDDPAREVLTQGGDTFDQWLSSHNQNIFLIVTEYAPRWRGLGPA